MPKTANAISDKAIGRLSLYRRALHRGIEAGAVGAHIFSHELARLVGLSAAIVRRDIMTIGFSGSPSRGYNAAELIESIGRFLDAPEAQKVALVGVGNIGRALLSYFAYRRPKLSIVAAFDVREELAGRLFLGCRCYDVHQMEEIVRSEDIRVGIIAVPASEAQQVVDGLLRAGVTGFLNFSPVALRTPSDVYVDNIDMTMSLEKVAFFAQRNIQTQGGVAS